MPTSYMVNEMLRPLNLTPEETEMLTQEAKRIIAETLAACELFVANDRQLPKNEWKHVKTKEHVQVYRSRKGKRSVPTTSIRRDSISNSSGTSSSSTTTTIATGCSSSGRRQRSNTWGKNTTLQRMAGMSSFSGGSASRTSTSCDSSSGSSANCESPISRNDLTAEISKTKPASLPLAIATGIVPGTVEDLAFGALAYNERLTRHRDAHLEEKFEGVKVLATIVRPTAQDPFQSLVVKWTYRNVSALSRMRDRVFIEANGIMTDSNGNEVAYHLVHSIDSIPRIPGFKHLDIMRANLSTCYISRQFDQSSVEIFCRGFVDPGGNLAESITISVFTDFMLSVVHVVDCAYTKKLTLLAYRKQQSAATNSDSQIPSSHCSHCAASLTTFGNLIHTGTACRACRQEICNKCSVTKKLTVEASSTEMKLKSVVYCLHCVIEAKQAPTREVAVALMALYDPQWNQMQT